MKPKISPGNSKLGKLANISLPPIKSCADNVPCSKQCYALKAYRCYPSCKDAWNHNWYLYKNHSYKYFKGINEHLTEHKPSFFRWHVSGDIPDISYLDSMISIAKKHKDTKFLAFTKRYDYFKNKRIPKNLAIVFSAWPGLDMPKQRRFPIAFMQDGTETRVKNAVECPGNCENCGMCWSLKTMGKNVVFHKH